MVFVETPLFICRSGAYFCSPSVNDYGYLGYLLISENGTNKKIDRRIATGGQRFGQYVDSLEKINALKL